MDITNNTEAVYLFLFGISILASFIDSIAGGGGLLTTPSMLLVCLLYTSDAADDP